MKPLRTFFRPWGIIARRASALLFPAIALMPSEKAFPDEGGVPFWPSGTYASFAAVPPEPGWYMPIQLYYYNGDASGTKSFQRGDAVVSGLNSKATVLVFVTPTWAPDEKWFGGQPSFSLTFGGGWNSTTADLSISTVNLGTQTLNRSNTDAGGADLYPQAQIAWSSG